MIQPLATLVVVHVLGFISAVRALPNGAPLASCAAILPDPSPNGHQSAGLAAANSPFTFNVTALARGYVGGTTYSMTLTGGTTRYQGLLIQGRLASDLTTPAGTFINLATTTQIAPCGVPSGSAITHTNNNLKNNLAFQWTAPPVGTGNVVFLYTIVISLSNYYRTQLTATIPELISGTTAATNARVTTAAGNAEGAADTSGNSGAVTWNAWTVSAVSIVVVIASVVGVVFFSVTFGSLALQLHKWLE